MKFPFEQIVKYVAHGVGYGMLFTAGSLAMRELATRTGLVSENTDKQKKPTPTPSDDEDDL